MSILEFNRIIIIGNNGSGKSFLAKELAKITNLPLIHLDMEFWREDWQKPEEKEWIAIQKSLIAKEKWIIEGNHSSTMELRFKATDLVIFLDINRFTCLISVVKRHGKNRLGSPDYLNAKFNKDFFKFCKRLWDFPKDKRKLIIALHKKYPQKEFLIINSRKKANKLFELNKKIKII